MNWEPGEGVPQVDSGVLMFLLFSTFTQFGVTNYGFFLSLPSLGYRINGFVPLYPVWVWAKSPAYATPSKWCASPKNRIYTYRYKLAHV